jgi:biopolymer transport protein ExbD
MRIRRTTDDGELGGGGEGGGMVDGVFILNVLNKIFVTFILATTFLSPEKEMDLALPEAQSGRPEKQAPQEVIINVLADGRMKVGERYLEQEALVEHLKQVALADSNSPVTIRGDRATVFQNAVKAMDACGRANLHRISVGILDGRE